MSIKVTSWALNEAPVDQPVQVLILVAMAERCRDDGTESRQSVATIASKARVSVRTVHRELKALETMGVIRRGDQALGSHLPANRRPVVYDLAVEMRRGDNLSYQDRGDTSVMPEQPSGVTTTTLRGDNHDTSGVTRMADNTSLDSSLNSPVVSTSPETAPIEFEPPAKVAYTKTRTLFTQFFPDVKWMPSLQAFEQSITLYPEADTVRTAVEYVRKNRATKGYVPTDEKWLSWCAQADKQVKDKQRELETKLAEAKKEPPRPWCYTAADD